MLLALPALGSLIGGALFSWGTTAMTVGWMVGAWLAGPQTGANKPGMDPAAMPMLNQALRGSPMFITFGTNRVSSQIVWSKNYKPIRHNSGGKGGKGGGSGNMGSMKGGGSGAYYYTYTWDLMFHFGMVDVPVVIRNGWIGGDRVTAHTIAIWNSTVDNAPGIGLTSLSPQKATLDAVETFFAPGFPTGSADLDTWAYFTSQENGALCAWPYTSWLGFKSLNLGQSPVIPQLSVELTPLAGSTFTSTPLGYDNNFKCSDAGSSLFENMPTNNMMLLGDDGKHYVIFRTNNKHILYCIETDTATTMDTTFIANRFTESTSAQGTQTDVCVVCPETPYFYILTNTPTAHVTYEIYACRCRINSSGVVEGVGYVQAETGDLLGIINPDGVRAATVWGNEVHIAASSGDTPLIFSLPLTTNFGSVSPGTWNTFFKALGFGAGIWRLTGDWGTRDQYQFASVVRTDDGTPGVLIYIDQSAADASSTNTLLLNATAPQVWFSDGPFALRDMSADFGVPFDDTMKNFAGTTSVNYRDDYSAPSVLNGDAIPGGYIAFCRSYSDKAEYMRTRMFNWNLGVPVPVIDTTFRLLDSVSNLGVSGGNRDIVTPVQIQLGYDVNDFTVKAMATYNNSTAGGFNNGVAFSDAGSIVVGQDNMDVTPAYIIYRILTNPVFGIPVAALFGFSVTASRIDAASYAAAAAACEAQGIKVSTTYTRQDNLLSVLDNLLSLYGGFLTEVGGMINFGMAQESDDTGRVVDNSHLIPDQKGAPPVQITKAARQDGYNQIQFNYIDRALDYKNNQVEVADEVDIDINGPRPKSFPSAFVMPGSLAQMEAERALWSNLYGRNLFNFNLGWKDMDLTPGDVITLVDSFDTSLQSGKKVRLVKKKETKRGRFAITAVEHIGFHMTANHSFTNVTSYEPNGDYIVAPERMRDFRMYELPKEFQGARAKSYVGYNQATLIMGAQLHLSGDGANFIQAADVQPYGISGIFADGLSTRPPGWMERDVTLYLMPRSGHTPTTPTYAQTHALDDVTQAMRAAGGGVIFAGSEALSIEGLTLLAQNKYRAARVYRGWGGTPIGAHNSGDFWHYHAPGIFEHEITEDDIGTTVWYKVVPYNFAGVAFNIASIDARTYTFKGIYWLPRIQPPTGIYVQSPVNWTQSLEWGKQYLNVTSGGCDITLTWPGAANNEGYGAGGYGAAGYGHFSPDITVPTYRVEVRSSNGVTVRSTLVQTGFFSYTMAQNSADFTGFGRDLIFKVTPYNIKGDGPASDIRSLSLFW